MNTETAPPSTETAPQRRHRIVVVGGGTAGITVAARLARAGLARDVAIVEPNAKHHYQPLWTLVGAGVATLAEAERDEASLIPSGVSWIRDRVASLDPERDTLTLESGESVGYDWLVVAPGIQIDWHKVEGLPECVGHDGVCSNYDRRTVGSTWEALRGLEAGDAVFTMPSTPVKCGGAPQKILYLAADHLRRRGLAGKVAVHFYSAAPRLFGVPAFQEVLAKTVARYGIVTHFREDLVAVDAARRVAVFRNVDTGARTEQPYAMLHVTPPMAAPDFVARSPLAGPNGWVEVDLQTLRHPRFPNVFALGDAAGLPTAKTGAAIRKQAPVLVANLRAAMAGAPASKTYDGYTSCPVVTGYGRLVMAEFDYENRVHQSFPLIDQKKERWDMYLVKRHLLPRMYWWGMLRGWL